MNTPALRYTRPCECGCGELVTPKRYLSHVARYIAGHSPGRPDHHPWTDAEDDYMRENYGRLTSAEIARHLGVSKEAVKSRCAKGLRLNKGGQKRTLKAWFDHYTPDRPADDCWEWKGTRNAAGYGFITCGTRFWFAHRLSLHLALGTVPRDSDVLHRCDNPPCVNPAHLYLGNDSDNQRDVAKRSGRTNQRLTPNDVREIRRRHANGEGMPELARAFGVTRSNVSCVVRRISWDWLPDEADHTEVQARRHGRRQSA